MVFLRLCRVAALVSCGISLPAFAQDGASLTELVVSQGGQPVPVSYEPGPDPVSPAFVTLEKGAFDLTFPRGTCGPEEGVKIRVHPAEMLESVLADVNEQAAFDTPSDTLDALFQPGYGMAAEAGPVTVLYIDDNGAAPAEQGFNYFFAERYSAADEERATISVTSVEASGFNLLDSGAPFVLVIGRIDCAYVPRLLLDVLTVSFE